MAAPRLVALADGASRRILAGVVHVCCALVGAALAVLAVAGLALRVGSWASGLVGVAAVFAFGLAAIDRALVSRIARGRSLVLAAICLDAALLVAGHHGAPPWFLLAVGIVSVAALGIGLLAIIAGEEQLRR